MTTEFHAFPDTNVLVHFSALDGLDWRGLCGADQVVVYITQSVLAELNKLKEIGNSKRVRKRAASVQRRLKQLLGTHANLRQLAPKVKLIFEAETPDISAYPGLNAAIADDLLIASVLKFRSSNTEHVVIVTDDNGLGLVVKAGKWQIDIIEPPATARLPEEPDPDETEKGELHRQLAAIRSALPAPTLRFSNGGTLLNVPRSQTDIEAAVRKAVETEREKHRFLPEPKGEKRVGKLSLGALAASNESYASVMQNDPVQVRKYNEALQKYFCEFEEAKRTNAETARRILKIELQVENTGNVPARDVLVRMDFPAGFTILQKGKRGEVFRKMPEPPMLPGYMRPLVDPMRSLMTSFPTIGSIDPLAPSISIRKTNSYEVCWHIPKLRQRDISDVDPIYILFDKKPFSFHIDCSIVADNLPDTVMGQLHVVIS
jgi:hypothetical protein